MHFPENCDSLQWPTYRIDSFDLKVSLFILGYNLGQHTAVYYIVSDPFWASSPRLP
jgi:hypothetical protein